MNLFVLGLRALLRDARSGDLRLLVLAVILAVAAFASVGFLADRFQSALVRDARQMLGGDAVVVSDNPTPTVLQERVRALGLTSATSLSFPTMVRAPQAQGGETKLVALKAVEAGYPLRGALQLQPAQDINAGVPQPGRAWVDAAVLDSLGLELGQQVLLGQGTFVLDRIIVTEPDRGAGFMNFAPRIMIGMHDLAATGLIQPASRITYRMAVVGPQDRVEAFVAWGQTLLGAPGASELRGVRLETLQQGRPEMAQTLERAQKFLGLVALLTAMLSAVAVGLAARTFAANRLDDCAVMRVFGVRYPGLLQAYLVEFAAIAVISSALGLGLGYGVHLAMANALDSLVGVNLPPPSWMPLGLGLGLGVTLLVAFGVTPVLHMARVPALRVIRRDLGNQPPWSFGLLVLGLLGYGAVLLLVSGDMRMGLTALAGFAGAWLLFAALGWIALRGLRQLVREDAAPQWLVLATRQVAARPAQSVVQIGALATGLLALILLVLLRTDLVHAWRSATPVDAPNRFVINIMPDQAQAFEQHLRSQGVVSYDWYPMVRGRLVAINGLTVGPQDYADERAKRLVDREFNLSYSAQQPGHNQIVAGAWQAESTDAVSVEEGIAKTLGLKLGDTLRFDMGGVQSESVVRSLRKVDWSSMRANFFVMYPVSRMDDVPVTYMTAFRAPQRGGFDRELLRHFPNVTSVDMSVTINQVQRMLGQVIAAVEFLFVFALCAGLVVLLATVLGTRQERLREYAIMRAVGAAQGLLIRVLRTEMLGVGFLAGFLAALAALAISWALARYVFEFAWTPAWWVALAGGVCGAVLALGAGWWGLRDVLKRPVLESLRA